jgi:hypothetical protein
MNNIFGQPIYNNYDENCGCHRNAQLPEILPQRDECKQLCGTVFRINIPAGAEINILNLVELASPSGICLILRLPFLGGECKPNC